LPRFDRRALIATSSDLGREKHWRAKVRSCSDTWTRLFRMQDNIRNERRLETAKSGFGVPRISSALLNIKNFTKIQTRRFSGKINQLHCAINNLKRCSDTQSSLDSPRSFRNYDFIASNKSKKLAESPCVQNAQFGIFCNGAINRIRRPLQRGNLKIPSKWQFMLYQIILGIAAPRE
jgi:hypothetical protein